MILDSVLPHLYISPLERCNLCRKMCYTTKTSSVLTNDQILAFIHRYQQVVNLQTITFCGGEVFLIPDFVNLINTLTSPHEPLFIQIITNGTLDHLDQITTPNSVKLIVSLDGLPDYHDRNRGRGMWQKSVAFLTKALSLGFHCEVFSIVTKENLSSIDDFETEVASRVGESLPITYHPRKPLTYLQNHPTSNQLGQTTNFSFLESHQILELAQTKAIFPPLDLGCFQISLMSDGKVYGCCEGINPLGSLTTPIPELIYNLKSRINNNCVEPEFVCGLKDTYVSSGS